ncbi:apolipoprotein N-acyltransferase [Kineosporia sp. NBRC 101731]|uniref:apolipoprotein N-acyltransferase n=1 Tax=Kineosporia sp. NBRC 101731 TaxID=3032199 RepID=UPI0024A062BD|nr:apolipoprotein N-acyltransferase [Kineosporia sp. NBRC 101731]GLY31860.1 apolipoprotein N-acyltransferase [Kineosporia sp. NBRC 101731]
MSDSAVVEPGVGSNLGREAGQADIAHPVKPQTRSRRGPLTRLRQAGPALVSSLRTSSGRLAWARLLLAGVSGYVLHLAFPGIGIWPLAPVGVAGLALATRGVSGRFGALLGFVFGLVFFLRLIPWIGIYVGALPWVALSITEALYVAAMGALLPRAWRARGGLPVLLLASGGLWVAQEAVRGRWPFGGFPWGRLAFSQSQAPTAPLASIGGAPLVSFAVAVAGTLLAWAVVKALLVLPGLRSRALRQLALPALGVALALAVMGFGTLIPLPTAGSGDDSTTRVAAVQGNVPRAGLDFNSQRRAVLDNHVNATMQLAQKVATGEAEQPDVVLWPENASDIDPYINADAAAEISAATDAIGVPILIGAVVQGPGDYVSNTGIVWRPGQGAGTGDDSTYVKRHPAPFGEYMPYRDFFRLFSSKVDLISKDFVSGDKLRDNPVGVMRMGNDDQDGQVRVGDVICFEVAYDSLVRDSVRAGATMLAVQTNNATFGYTDESVQQLAQSQLRAIESGRTVVNISTVGVSGIILPDGTVVARSGHYTQDVLEATVPLRTELTIATRVGEWPEWILTALALGLVLGTALSRREKTS